MSDEPAPGLAPRDHEAEGRARARRRRRNVAIGAVAALAVGLGVAELTTGLVSRAVDATGLTCGGGWSRIDADELDGMRVVRWGTPEAREQDLDPVDLTDLPPGLAEPSLTTAAFPDDGAYDPLLYPLGGDVVLQGAGYTEQTWVAADARTGEPLWGVATDGAVSGVQGVIGLLAVSGDRTDLTTLDARTGDELSCVGLDGAVLDVAPVGDRDLVVATDVGDAHEEDGSAYRLTRVDPVDGEVRWSTPVTAFPGGLHVAGGTIVVSSRSAGAITTGWQEDTGGDRDLVIGVDAETGRETWAHRDPAQSAVLDAVALPDGGTGALLLEVPDRQAWDEAQGEYVLLDDTGEQVWRTPATYRRDDVAAWHADGVGVVLEDLHPVGLDLGTGERLWRAEGAGLEGDVGLLTGGDGAVVVLANQRVEDDDGGRFVTHVLDIRTGALTVHEAPLRSFRVTDTYVISSTGATQLVIPRLER
ncbi:outer membrane protein assembly factor BamB family protein [Actinotalea caeni]|uniref:outer membrane protein assembly factor BamB family protein n=1 Tax=Actinotalea caeni TaxID=1348467 RepID=UPI0012E16F12|nr:PQQ-binding-like beta-propeller repeat protein [Actinotalea caeni]